MVTVPFPSLSSPDKLNESGGRLVNLYPEKLNDGRIARRIVPGLRQLVETAQVGCRGLIEVNGQVLAVIGTRAYALTLSGVTFTATDLGAMPGTGRVHLARNNKAPTPDIVAVTDGTAYLMSLSAAPASYPDPDVGSPNSVCFQGGYFVFSYGDGRMVASGLNATTISTIDNAYAETRPDGLLRIVPIGRDLYAFGPETVEFWRNTGASPGFPYEQAEAVAIGAAGALAVAGWENGFQAGGLCFVGSDGIVYRFQGYQAVRISNHTVERAISQVANRATLDASVYMHDGHAVWALSCPLWTWCHDLTTGAWYERATGMAGRWQAQTTVRAFGRWIAGTVADGRVMAIDEAYKAEGDAPIICQAVSSTVTAIPNRARLDELALSCMVGVGDAAGNPTEADPHIGVAWSLNGGVTFGNPLLRSIGRQGQYRNRVRVLRMGQCGDEGAQFKVTYSGKTDFTLFGGELKVSRLG